MCQLGERAMHCTRTHVRHAFATACTTGGVDDAWKFAVLIRRSARRTSTLAGRRAPAGVRVRARARTPTPFRALTRVCVRAQGSTSECETFASAPLTTREDVETVFCRAPSGGDDEGKELMRMRANFSAVAVELYMFV